MRRMTLDGQGGNWMRKRDQKALDQSAVKSTEQGYWGPMSVRTLSPPTLRVALQKNHKIIYSSKQRVLILT